MILKFLNLIPFLKPIQNENGTYSPSLLSRLLAVPLKTNYKKFYSKMNTDKKVLVLCTEEYKMKMENGKIFLTGNHPVEFFVPLKHLIDSGIEYDFVTISGKPVAIEEWALPLRDELIMETIHSHREMLEKPYCIKDILNEKEKYDGIFIPGGHGAMLGLPESSEVSELLSYFIENGNVFSLCHGPAVLLSLKDRIKGMTLVAFPDFMDRLTPYIGYLPGKMTWFLGKELKKYGAYILFSLAHGRCYLKDNCLSGDGPKAAQYFGVLMVKKLIG